MIEIGVDIGGTFTDVVLMRDNRIVHYTKVPSTPSNLIEGVRNGVKRALAAVDLKPADVDRFVYGSTVAINTLIQQKGAVTGLLTTEGFEDVLEIGRHKRSHLYNLFLEPETPVFLAPRRRRFAIPERLAADGSVVKPLDEQAVRKAVEALSVQGVTAIAVCYLFSFRNPAHEQRTREIIRGMRPDIHVSISSDVDPAFREYERTVMTSLDTYLQGAVGDYVERQRDDLAQIGIEAKLQVMQSRGGITSPEAVMTRPVSLLLSGLAAGVIGSKHVAIQSGQHNVISLDMGGTSCDIALIRDGVPIVTNQTRVARFPLRMQMVDVNTIGAGGGSIAWVDGADSLRVGPQSAGAEPGPACYRRGGTEATVTDASLVLGYLNPEDVRRRHRARSRRRQGGDQARCRQGRTRPHRHRRRHSSHCQRAHERRGAPRLGTARLRPTPIHVAAARGRGPGARLRAGAGSEHRQSAYSRYAGRALSLRIAGRQHRARSDGNPGAARGSDRSRGARRRV